MNAQTKNPGIREAIKELMSVNAGSIFEARFQERLKQKRDRVAREDYVREEGREEEIFTSVFENDYSAERGAEKMNLAKDQFEVKYQKWLEEKNRR